MDRLFATVMPRILRVLQRVISGSGGGTEETSSQLGWGGDDFDTLGTIEGTLLALDYASMCSSSTVMVWKILAGIMTIFV